MGSLAPYTLEAGMGLFSKKTASLPETIPLGSWAMVQGSNQGSLLLARVRKGLGSSSATLPIPTELAWPRASAPPLPTGC